MHCILLCMWFGIPCLQHPLFPALARAAFYITVPPFRPHWFVKSVVFLFAHCVYMHACLVSLCCLPYVCVMACFMFGFWCGLRVGGFKTCLGYLLNPYPTGLLTRSLYQMQPCVASIDLGVCL